MAVRKHVRAHVGLDVHTKQPHTEALCAAESTLHVRTYSSSGDSLRLKGVLLRNIRLESPSTMARSELYAKPWQTGNGVRHDQACSRPENLTRKPFVKCTCAKPRPVEKELSLWLLDAENQPLDYSAAD